MEREYVMKMVSSFGLYLGTISPPKIGDYTAWTVVVATDSLERIPQKMETIIGGLRSIVRILPVKWEKAPIYEESDLPKQPQKFSRPIPSKPTSSSRSIEGLSQSSDDEMISIPRWMVLDICKGKDPTSLPNDLQTYLDSQPQAVPDKMAGGSLNYQPVDLSMVVVATENPGFNNPKEASPVRALTITDPEKRQTTSPSVTILRRSSVVSPITVQIESNTEVPGEECPQTIKERITTEQNLSHSSRLPPLPNSENMPSPTEPSLAAANSLQDLLRSTCPQNVEPSSGPNQYGLRNVNKRKTELEAHKRETGGPSKRWGDTDQAENQTPLKLGLEGFYEVQISDSFCKELAQGWGLLPEVVRREVQRDNLERQEVATVVLETQFSSDPNPQEGSRMEHD